MSFLSPSIPSPQQQPQPPAIPPPTPVPPAPDRSDSDIQEAAALQRKKYGIAGGASQNMMTGGMGVSVGSTYSAVTSMLGGTSHA